MHLYIALLLHLLYHQIIASPPRLLIVSFDGFRHDYISASATPHMMTLREKSTWAEHMVNIFPTKTFPNHHAIATGSHADRHGVIGSHLVDKGDVIGYSQRMFDYNPNAVPIWIVNEQLGYVSGSMMWLAGEFAYNNTRATHRRPLDRHVAWQEKVDTVISWFQNDTKPANLVMMYFDQPDFSAHRTGATSSNTSAQIKRVDDICGHLDTRLREAGLLDVNVFLMADHGMADVPFENIMDVSKNNTKLQDVKDLYSFIGGTPVLQIIPNPGQEDVVYEAFSLLAVELKHFKVYRKSELPARWHIANCSRTPAILVVADLGYGFDDLHDEYHPQPGAVLGVHGFDNKHMEMRPFFMAWGPDIKQNHKIPAFHNVDLYALWTTMLGRRVDSDGDYERVRAMRVDSSAHAPTTCWPMIATTLALLLKASS